MSGGDPERAGRDALASYAEFYRYWMPRLTGYLRSQTFDGRWVEDIAQESMLAAQARWDELLTYDRPGAWLFRVATTMLRRWQSKAREQCTSLDDMITRGAYQGPAGTGAGTDGLLDLMNAMHALPRRQREAIALHGLLEFPLAEVAAILGISEGSAKTHVHRARRRLEELLAAAPERPVTAGRPARPRERLHPAGAPRPAPRPSSPRERPSPTAAETTPADPRAARPGRGTGEPS
ncbi:MAG TPA: RNA polymerase sigma factor [Thermomonospora sp.]|nr:RNA polymerase sigma factor [Thermomonospora sp.]